MPPVLGRDSSIPPSSIEPHPNRDKDGTSHSDGDNLTNSLPTMSGRPFRVHRPPSTQSAYSALDFRKDFFFRRRSGALDWSKIRKVDLERIVRTVDVDELQENVENITFADITERDLEQLTDANFLQLFRLSQLIIEYLLNVQNFLLASAKKKESTYEQVLAELESTRNELSQRIESERGAKKELKYCRRVIKAYERNLGQRYEAAILNQNCLPSTSNKCLVCSSVFVSYDYLVGHYRRRHPNDEPPPQVQSQSQSQPRSTEPSIQSQSSNLLPPSIDLNAWKKEMESAIRAQLMDSQRSMRSNDKTQRDEEANILGDRLAKLESTLAAVLNNNTLPPTATNPSPLVASRAGLLRDDDGGARLLEDNGSLKEYLRRELFDLREELASLKEEKTAKMREQAYFAPFQADHQPMPTLSLTHLSPTSTQLLQRFRSDPVPTTNLNPTNLNSNSIHPSLSTSNTAESHPLPQPQPQPQPPISLAVTLPTSSPPSPPVRSPLLPSDPNSLRKAREIMLRHHDKKFELFPDLPGLLARFPHRQDELVGHLNSFAILSSTLAEQGSNEVEAEMVAQGCQDLLPEIEQFLEEYTRSYYTRPVELIEQFRSLADRSARFDSLGTGEVVRDAYNAAARAQWNKERGELDRFNPEAQRAPIENDERMRLERESAEAEDKAEAAERVETHRQQQSKQIDEYHQTTTKIESTQPVPASMPATPSVLPTQLSNQMLPLTHSTSHTRLNPPSSTAASTVESTTSALPSPLPSSLPSTFSSIAGSYDSSARPPPFSNHSNILNPPISQPTPTAISTHSPPSRPVAPNSTATSKPLVGILKPSPDTVRRFDEYDEEDDVDEAKSNSNPRPMPSRRLADDQHSSGSRISDHSATFRNAPPISQPRPINPFPTPAAVPVPIPPRPNKATIAALSKPTTPLIEMQTKAESIETAAPTSDVNEVQPFNADPPTPALMRRTESRRLSTQLTELDDEVVTRIRSHTSDDDVNRRYPSLAPSTIPEPDSHYEHSTARRDLDGDDGLENEYAQREAERAEQHLDDDVHHFSPPMAPQTSGVKFHEPITQLHSDDEDEDEPTGAGLLASHQSSHFRMNPSLPSSQVRHVGDLRNLVPSNLFTANRFGRMIGTSQSANFSVASSSDWKSEASEKRKQIRLRRERGEAVGWVERVQDHSIYSPSYLFMSLLVSAIFLMMTSKRRSSRSLQFFELTLRRPNGWISIEG